MFDTTAVARDFPILSTLVHGKPLIYLDNAATTQLPETVLNVINDHYRTQNANVHRGVHYLSERSTMAMEEARKNVQSFISASSSSQVIFTSGTTDSLNTIAMSYLWHELKQGDQVIVSEFEHHSNYVVWQQLCREKNARFTVIPEKGGTLDMDLFLKALDSTTKLVSMTLISNVTGVRLPVEELIRVSHKAGVPVCIDGAQAVRHGINTADLECDFLCFSSHKMMGPAGVGVLYVASDLLGKMKPCRYGGGMVEYVTREDTSFAGMPYRLEAGTPNYPGIIGLGAAVQYLTSIGVEQISRYENSLTSQLENVLKSIDSVHIIGGSHKKHSVVSVELEGIHAYDAACLFDKYGVALRSGNHCAQPIVRKLGYDSVLRFSPAFYNTAEEIESLREITENVIHFFKR